MTSKAIEFSVIIPTFNRATVLNRALQSVQKQTHPATDIWVIDDGSTDNTQSVLSQFGAQINVIQQQNTGVSSARNRGIKACNSQWIAFLDSDDEWHPKKLEKQADAIGNNDGIKICHTNEVWYRNQRFVNPHKKHEKKGGMIYGHCLPRCAISPSSVVIHRSVFQHLGDFDPTLPACEDYDLWLRITSVYPVHYLEEKLTIKHGGHDDQLSQQYWGMDRFRIQSLLKMLNTNTLTPTQYSQTLDVFTKKVNILEKGALKHHNEPLLAWIKGIKTKAKHEK